MLPCLRIVTADFCTVHRFLGKRFAAIACRSLNSVANLRQHNIWSALYNSDDRGRFSNDCRCWGLILLLLVWWKILSVLFGLADGALDFKLQPYQWFAAAQYLVNHTDSGDCIVHSYSLGEDHLLSFSILNRSLLILLHTHSMLRACQHEAPWCFKPMTFEEARHFVTSVAKDKPGFWFLTRKKVWDCQIDCVWKTTPSFRYFGIPWIKLMVRLLTVLRSQAKIEHMCTILDLFSQSCFKPRLEILGKLRGWYE